MLSIASGAASYCCPLWNPHMEFTWGGIHTAAWGRAKYIHVSALGSWTSKLQTEVKVYYYPILENSKQTLMYSRNDHKSHFPMHTRQIIKYRSSSISNLIFAVSILPSYVHALADPWCAYGVFSYNPRYSASGRTLMWNSNSLFEWNNMTMAARRLQGCSATLMS